SLSWSCRLGLPTPPRRLFSAVADLNPYGAHLRSAVCEGLGGGNILGSRPVVPRLRQDAPGRCDELGFDHGRLEREARPAPFDQEALPARELGSDCLAQG